MEELSNIISSFFPNPLIAASKSAARKCIVNRVSSTSIEQLHVIIFWSLREDIEKRNTGSSPIHRHGMWAHIILTKWLKLKASIT
jgi:hypothetical protein